MSKILKIRARQVFDSVVTLQLKLRFIQKMKVHLLSVPLVHPLELMRHMKKETRIIKNILVKVF